MDKKIFNINELFNNRRDDRTLEEVLGSIVKTVELDQQDIIDILTVSSKQYAETVHFFTARAEGQPSGYPRPWNNVFGWPRRNSQNPLFAEQQPYGPKSYTGEEHPEYIEQVFAVTTFQIIYLNTVLSDTFKFVGVDGEYLTYLGRDHELAKVAGSVTVTGNMVTVYLDCMKDFPMVRVQQTHQSIDTLQQAHNTNAVILPGTTPVATITRNVMNHLRSQGWRTVTEGDLVCRVDAPEQIYLMGLRVEDQGDNGPRVMVIPVDITEGPEGIVATPNATNIQTLDLMLLTPYTHTSA